MPVDRCCGGSGRTGIPACAQKLARGGDESKEGKERVL